jgi:CubicO group peptidase (beta-lactamase class C family)
MKGLEEPLRWNSKCKTYAVGVSYRGTYYERYKESLHMTKDTPIHAWSMAKSVLSLLMGIRQKEIGLDLDGLVKAPEVRESVKKARGATFRNLLNMRMLGLYGELDDEEMLFRAPSTAAWFAEKKMETTWQIPEGTTPESLGIHTVPWRYSQGIANLMSRELRFTFEGGDDGQQEYAMYPWKKLFSKINASSFVCEPDPAGTFMFSTFCYATLRDWLRIGELVMNKGAWGKEQIVPEEWIKTISTPVANDTGSHYSHMWYLLDHVYAELSGEKVIAARGMFGNQLVVVPERGLVFTRLGSNDCDSGDEGIFLDFFNKIRDYLPKDPWL